MVADIDHHPFSKSPDRPLTHENENQSTNKNIEQFAKPIESLSNLTAAHPHAAYTRFIFGV